MWKLANKAFGENLYPAFEELHSELRSSWQIFRGAEAHQTAEEVFSLLMALCRTLFGG